VFCDLVRDLIGPDVRLYWDQAVYKKPGTRADFPWHQDNGYTFVEPQAYLTCWVALTDATEANGCPRVVPGLHRGGTLAHQATDLGLVCFDEPPREPIAAPVRAGGIVVFSSLTPHATGPNLTGETRRAYILQYAPDGAIALRPGENGAITREVCALRPNAQFRASRRGSSSQPGSQALSARKPVRSHSGLPRARRGRRRSRHHHEALVSDESGRGVARELRKRHLRDSRPARRLTLDRLGELAMPAFATSSCAPVCVRPTLFPARAASR
jgi:hypothetical protein